MNSRIARIALVIIALFYAYGALVHVMNMAGMTGFDWLRAPLKWQLLDIIYLLIDVIAVVGLVLDRRYGIVAVLIGACSQIVLYTVLREWILDVPTEFTPEPEQIAYLDYLLVFHVIALIVVAGVVWLRRP